MPDQDPDRIPVIVGVGQINDRPEQPGDGLDPVGLMAEALRRADADANAGHGLLADCDSLAVVAQLGWPQLNPVDEKVADSLRIPCWESCPGSKYAWLISAALSLGPQPAGSYAVLGQSCGNEAW